MLEKTDKTEGLLCGWNTPSLTCCSCAVTISLKHGERNDSNCVLISWQLL